MIGEHERTGTANTRASRRHFFKMLAGSPLLALAYPALSLAWQREVDRELERARSASGAARMVCADCGQEFQLPLMRPMRLGASQAGASQPQAPNALDVHFTGQVVDTPEDAHQRLGLRAGRPREHAAVSLGLHPPGRRRPRDALRESRRLPAAGAASAAAGSGRPQARHIGVALRPALDDAAVPVSGRGARGVPHRRRERGRASGPRARHPPGPVAPELAVVRGDRRSTWRAALVPVVCERRLGHHEAHDPEGVRRRLPRAGLDHRSCSEVVTVSWCAARKAARATTGRSARAATTTSRATSARCTAAYRALRGRARRSTGTT